MEYPLYDAFISYAHEDFEWAKWLYDGLSSRGLNVFLDDAVLHFGDNVPARIEESLEHSIAVLLLLSRQSRDSAWVKFESSFNWTSTFIDGKRRLIPVIIEEGCDVPARLRMLRSCTFAQKDDTKLQRLVDDLLSRQDLEIGPYQLVRGHPPEELAQNIVQTVRRYIPQAAARKLPLVQTAIIELVDNAFRHTSTGQVSLEAHMTRDHGQVIVRDGGDGFDLRDALVRSRRQVDSDPTTVGQRGLTLLEGQGVRLLGGSKNNKEHWVKATIWWTLPSLVRVNECVTISPRGRIDYQTAASFEALLAPHANDPKTKGIVLDFANVEDISSVGLRVLLILAKTARANHCGIALFGLQPKVAEIFAISRFDTVVEICTSRADAEAAVGVMLRK